MSEPYCTVQLTEEQRQIVLLAMGNLAYERPGFDPMLGELAERLEGRTMFETFKDLKRDEELLLVQDLRQAYQGSTLPGPAE